MKKLFQNPTFALIITIILVISTTLLNTHVRLGSISNDVAESFYRSSSEVSIADSMRDLINAAEKLSILAEGYRPSESAEAKENIEALRSMLRYESASPDLVFSCYSSLLSNCFALESVLVQADLNEGQQEILADAMHEAAEAKAAIDVASYNDQVRQFQKRYNRFPTKILANLAGVSYPVLFA